MARLQIKIDDKLHKVVYIEYIDNIPHSVITMHFVETSRVPYWRPYFWDFFANNGDKADLRAYNSGSGGDEKFIQAPQYIDGYIGKYWISPEIKFKGKPKNAKELRNPIPLSTFYWASKSKKSINPFKCAEITNIHEYCEMCGHESADFCTEHKYDDDEGHE